MKLKCISRFRGEAEGVLYDFEPGQDVNVTDEVAQHLLHRSPDSFKIPAPDKPTKQASDLPDISADITAMSTETATGLVTPDRRARGGRKRK
jgi:hypothetical protein